MISVPNVLRLSDADREARRDALTEQIFQLECVEEALVATMPEVARRPEANPAAVLGLRIVKGAAAKAA